MKSNDHSQVDEITSEWENCTIYQMVAYIMNIYNNFHQRLKHCFSCLLQSNKLCKDAPFVRLSHTSFTTLAFLVPQPHFFLIKVVLMWPMPNTCHSENLLLKNLQTSSFLHFLEVYYVHGDIVKLTMAMVISKWVIQLSIKLITYHKELSSLCKG